MKRLFCKLFHHKLYLIRKLTGDSDLIGCRRCGHFYAINHRERAILPFDKEMFDMYTKVFNLRNIKKYINQDKWFDLILG